MQAGQLREIITIMVPDVEMGDLRSPEMTYREGWRTRAAVKTPGTSRTIDNAELFFSATAVFRVRIYHKNKITPDMRIKWAGGIYRIIGVETDRARMEMIIKTELVNE